MRRSTFDREREALRTLLRQIRVEAGLRQEDVARRLGETQTFVSKCERGERNIDVVELVRFCEAIGADALEVMARFLAMRRRLAGARKGVRPMSRRGEPKVGSSTSR